MKSVAAHQLDRGRFILSDPVIFLSLHHVKLTVPYSTTSITKSRCPFFNLSALLFHDYRKNKTFVSRALGIILHADKTADIKLLFCDARRAAASR